ncbi:NAD-dependent epimerase/dehydratase family protein [Oligella urethralis]|uniref:dTDP-glucose 4,6-dehydratase n=1 Tax=Oligella urethralis TaxID=90245 RepID=A0A2X1UNV6_9BURK|nr:NAD(P)-dependent oxidoreductase [Oligella urethralis]SPY08738.1 dTDP-glucose 4,6-dehydratase [Oligella urethralis]
MNGLLKLNIAVLGATSPVGQQVLHLLSEKDVNVFAISRSIESHGGDISWINASDFKKGQLPVEEIHALISVAPIWKIKEYLPALESLRCEKVVCLSSTSRFTKTESSSAYEEQVVTDLIGGENAIQSWSKTKNVNWTILRPTLIYGRGNDRNLSEIAKIIHKLKFFPVFGEADGLRQPIYVDDVANACVLAVFNSASNNKAYNISGAEVLTYKEMVGRVFEAMKLKRRFLTINLSLFNFALLFLKLVPRYKNWNTSMVQRMNSDMVFDHEEAKQDFGFEPQKFVLTEEDVKVVN